VTNPNLPSGNRPLRGRWWRVAVTVAATLLLLPGLVAAASDDDAPLPSRGEDAVELTLLGGLEVTVVRDDRGEPEAIVEPNDLPDGIRTVEVIRDGDALYVIPDMWAEDFGTTLDPALFDVVLLAERELEGGIPVIVEKPTGDFSTFGVAGLEIETELASIDMVAGTLDPAAPVGSLTTSATATPRIWLDAEVHVTLEESVTQIGADVAWSRGLDGDGVTVAVLDTGVDSDHPDLAGRLLDERNFTSGPSASDGHGHGTHVAATVLGIGAAGSTTRTGVAPGASLLSGKVMTDGGSGQASWIIAGMEWAAEQGADIVNLSLGGAPTDGTDPMSAAVDALTEEHGTLFVISAGNSGPRDRTIGAPGAATSALTVGAVDRQDAVASFSSRGPRLGDFAMKPELTAPGVAIAAARASGTSMGTPIDEVHTRASGTSMAAPHVAGVAALVKQANPDFSAAELRSVLIGSSADIEAAVFDAGAGRVDADAATSTTITVDRLPVDLGYLPYGSDDLIGETTLTVTNHGDDTAELDLALVLEGQETGSPLDDVTVTPSNTTLDPGDRIEVELSADATDVAYDHYLGAFTVTEGDNVVLSSPAALLKEDERYDITITFVDAGGEPAYGNASWVDVINVDDRSLVSEVTLRATGPEGLAVRVPPGTYSVMGLVNTRDEAGVLQEVTMAGDPEVEVIDGDVHVVVDASEAELIDVTTPRGTEREEHRIAYHRRPEVGNPFTHIWMALIPDQTVRHSLGHVDAATAGTFEYYSKFRLRGPGGDGAPYLYELLYPEPYVDGPLDYDLSDDNLHVRTTSYYENRRARSHTTRYAAERPYEGGGMGLVVTSRVESPMERLELRNVSDTLWAQHVALGDWRHDVSHEPYHTVDAPGEEATFWHRQPFVPTALPDDAVRDHRPVAVTDGTLDVELAEFTMGPDRWAGQFNWATWRDNRFQVWADETELVDQVAPDASIDLPEGTERIRMDLRVAIPEERTDNWMSSTTLSSWDVEVPNTDGAPLPMLFVDYDIPVDLTNHVAAKPPGGTHRATLRLGHQDGADVPGRFTVRAWASHDDGATWQEVTRGAETTGPTVPLRIPAADGGTGYGSIRVEVEDRQGNRLEQTVLRAWRNPT
jgi:subtilisin family serine protease